MVQLAAHAKSSTLCGWLYCCTSKFFWPVGLLIFCIIMGLHSASSAIIVSFKKSDQKANFIVGSNKIQKDIFCFVALMNNKKNTLYYRGFKQLYLPVHLSNPAD